MLKALVMVVMVKFLDLEEEEETKGRVMTRSWLKKREELGYFTSIVRELQLEDTERFKETVRMNFKHFNKILNLIAPDITPQEIIGGNKVISDAGPLTVTLRFLATGETFQSLTFQFHISDRAIPYIVKEVCNTIVKYLVPLYLKVPSTEEECLSIVEKFETRWQYPNATGAIDGKHVVIRKSSYGGLHYYNYKHSHAIILIAIVGPSYECLYADIGRQ